MCEETPTNETVNGRFATIVRTLIALIAIVVLAVGVAILFNRYSYLAEIANSFRLQVGLCVFCLGAMLWYCRFRKWAVLQMLYGLSLLFPIISATVPIKQCAPGPEQIDLLSFNVLASNDDPLPTIEMLQQSGADVVVFIEYVKNWVEPVKRLENIYPYSVTEPRWHGFGLAMFSRYPILDSEIIPLTKNYTDNVFVVAYIDLNGQELAICGCHFLAPMSQARAQIRNQQIVEAAKIIERVRFERNVPVVLVGDYNCVPWSSFLNDIKEVAGLRDSRQGYGYQGSWPTSNLLLSIPIDNAFVSSNVHIHERSILKPTNSDHYPLFLKFSIASEAYDVSATAGDVSNSTTGKNLP